MASPYRLILFDCFNTLFLPDTAQLPTIEVAGKSVPSTAPLLMPHLDGDGAGTNVEALHRAMRAAWRWSGEQRGEAHREVPALRRFERMFEELGMPIPAEPRLEALLAAHMAAVISCYVLPEAHREMLARLRNAYRMAIFSNFDYAPALLDLLDREFIAGWFDPIVISAVIGYRKPGRAAFDHALAVAAEPAEAILFVGDSLSDDVAGARGVGLDIAWINLHGETPPPDGRPKFTLDALTDLEGLI